MNLGRGGGLGYLELTATPIVYATLSATTFKFPANTGAAPAYPSNATGIEQLAIRYKFDRDTALFGIYINIDKDLKLQILTSVDNIYTQSPKAKYMAYGNLS